MGVVSDEDVDGNEKSDDSRDVMDVELGVGGWAVGLGVFSGEPEVALNLNASASA